MLDGAKNATKALPGESPIFERAAHAKRRDAVKRLLIGLLLPILFACCLSVGYAGDPELVSIQTIVAQAPSYESHLVMLQGVVRDVQIISPGPPPPVNMMGGKCPLVWIYGRATFTFQDETGSLPVEVQGSCFRQQAVDALPKDGDMVRMTAIIHMLNRDLPVRLGALATEIKIFDPK
jgi:hypothetical protein